MPCWISPGSGLTIRPACSRNVDIVGPDGVALILELAHGVEDARVDPFLPTIGWKTKVQGYLIGSLEADAFDILS